MSDARVGRGLRAIRLRLGWRQRDVADRSGVSQPVISRGERGHFDVLTLRAIRRIAAALDAEVDVSLRWRGAAIDRLLDERHAGLVGALSERLTALRWEVATEVTYSRYGERGSIDLLGFHADTRSLLVSEIKTDVGSVEATVRKHDEEVRLAATVARERLGWHATSVSRLLVLPAESTARRQVDRHRAIFDRAYPSRGRAVAVWLGRPIMRVDGLLFLSFIPRATLRQARVRQRGSAVRLKPRGPHEPQ